MLVPHLLKIYLCLGSLAKVFHFCRFCVNWRRYVMNVSNIFRMLYECGELTIRLKPRKRERVLDEEDEDNEDERGRKEGTRRRRHFYAQRLPRPLNLAFTKQGFLYQVNLFLELYINACSTKYFHYFKNLKQHYITWRNSIFFIVL